jgi:NodT family efflux transporter outer membrane factor (OMF) lipoprotein
MKIQSSKYLPSLYLLLRKPAFSVSKRFLWILAAFFLMLSACNPGKEIPTMNVENPDSFSESGNEALSERWWVVFDDDQLNQLIDSALTNNFNLKTTWQRLNAAQASARRESAPLFPWLDASAGAQVRHPKSRVTNTQSLSVDLTASYELDLWGRIRSQADAAEFRAEAAHNDYKAASITLSAEITQTWFQLLETQNQLKLINSQIETNEKVLSLLKARFGSGQIRSVDILRQQQLLESTREQRITYQKNLELLKNQLAVLTGKPPQHTFDFLSDSLPLLPPMPDAGMPADLVQRRPDVQSAYELLKAADRDMAAAISNQYPRISLSASLSSASGSAQDLFDNWISSFAANLFAPLMYAGQRQAETDRAEAVKKQRLYQYGQTILLAFQEVEDALVQEKKQQKRIESIRMQLELARKTYRQLQLEYFNGMSNYLDVLTALDEEQRLQRALLSANLRLLEYRVGLHRALAGGFETEREMDSEASNSDE